jgi:hypothetical protein
MPYEVKYDDGNNQWSAWFGTQEEALAQAAMDTNVYGGTPAQEVVDDTGTQVHDQTEIIQAADELPS